MTTMTEPTTRTLEAPGADADLRRPRGRLDAAPPLLLDRLADGRRRVRARSPATSPIARS